MVQASHVAAVLAAAAILGAAAGVASVATTPNGRIAVTETAKQVSVAAGIRRARPPQPGDYWSGCDEPRALGTAPIYRGEPGYREGMDGDDDGIACEPIS